MRAIDYVLSRPEVDASRLGYMGQSGGGTMTALMEAADDRIKAAAPSCFLTSLRNLCAYMGPQDGEQNIYGQLAFGLNHAGYVLLGTGQRIFHGHGKPGGSGSTEGQGNVILLQNIHDE